MFLSRNKKNNVYPCKPQFYYIKVGFKGSILYGHVFVMGLGKFTLDIRTVEEIWVDPVKTALIGTEYIWSQGDNLHQISKH